jgi:hypothetical protein
MPEEAEVCCTFGDLAHLSRLGGQHGLVANGALIGVNAA